MRKIRIYTWVFILACMIVAEPIWAATISDIKKDQAETQKKLNSASAQIGDLEAEQGGIKGEINELDGALVETMASLSMIEEQIEQNKQDIMAAEADYQESKRDEAKQYEAMKLRIQFMYESGDTNYFQLLLEAKSFTEILNKADYIEQIYEHDRKLLAQYQETVKQVEVLKEELGYRKSDLETTEHEYKEEKAALDGALSKKKEESANYDVELTKMRQEAEAYKAMIKQQTALIKQLEAEEAARKAAEGKQSQKKQNNVYRVDPSIITNATGSELGKEIATYGCQFLGNPYVLGGTSLTNGADCSGFTSSVYRSFGYSIPRTSTEQRSAGTGVDYANAQPGDLVCYAGHVAIYIGGGKIVHANDSRTGIVVSNATYTTILAVRRVI